MKATLIIETDNELAELPLPVDDSMMLAIELETAFHDFGLIDDDERLEIIDRAKAKMLHY
jgi:hypothetical protein